jgi:hypothetical protein
MHRLIRQKIGRFAEIAVRREYDGHAVVSGIVFDSPRTSAPITV